KHTVLETGGNLVGGNRFRDREGPLVIGGGMLAVGEVLAGMARRPAAMHRQLALVEAEIDIFGLHARQIGQQQELILGLEDIHSRRDGNGAILGGRRRRAAVLQRKVWHEYGLQKTSAQAPGYVVGPGVNVGPGVKVGLLT